MQTGDTGLNLIKAYEGLRMTSYFTPSEEWAVGYGHRATARHGMNVTEGDALQFLKDDVTPIEALLQETVRAPLNQNEHDALVSLIFNIGEKNFRRSTALRKLNAGDKLGAAEAIEQWSKAKVDGELVMLDGLVRRRAAEKSLFLMPTDASLVVPSAEIVPADECDGNILSEEELKATPLLDMKALQDKQIATLTAEENNARMRALFWATQSLVGDPSKMIISKAEEREDIGVTIGASLAGLLALAMTGLGLVLTLDRHWPDVLVYFGLADEKFYAFIDNLHIWVSVMGAAICYFVLYILVKRAARHDLKKRRAREMARIKLSA